MMSPTSRKLAAGLAACAMAVIATQSPADAGTSTDYIRTKAPRANAAGAKFYHSGDELVVCDEKADGWGAIGTVSVWNPSSQRYEPWYSVPDPAYDGDVGCRTTPDWYSPQAIAYNGGRRSRNMPEGRPVQLEITVYQGQSVCTPCAAYDNGQA